MDQQKRPVGRPRDPDITDRATRAALETYGEHGWSGFSLNQVVRRSGLSKVALYARWSDKSELLTDAFRSIIPVLQLPAESEPHQIRQRLIDHAMLRAENYLGYAGKALYRLPLDAKIYPEVFEGIFDLALSSALREEQRIVKQAIDAGLLPPTISRVHLLDSIEGGVLFHILITPDHLLDDVRAHLREYVEHLVDVQLGLR